MALPPKRVIPGGETDYPWERAAIDFVLDALPDSDPHFAWPLHELLDAGTGRLYEIDLLVLARSGLFLIEIKSHPGVLTGNNRDWTFRERGGPARHIACPYPTTNHKAKVLASLLTHKLGSERPFVQPLVFVSHADVEVRLGQPGPEYVVTRETVRRTLVHGLASASGPIVNRPMMRRVREALRKIGLGPSRAQRVVGGYKLGELLDEREGYQEHGAAREGIEGDRARVRSYLVPRATSTERRHQLERAARREAKVLSHLGHHPNILSYRTFHDSGPLGPAVVFEAFEGGVPLDRFLKQEPDLSFDERLEILQAVVEALNHCHRLEIQHRNLSPASVLVRREEGQLGVRVHRFQTAAQSDQTSLGTRHVQQLAEDIDRLYQAPEVLRDSSKASSASDMFSVGCIAWLLFTGEHPAPSILARERIVREHDGLRIAAARADLAALDAVLAWATAPAVVNRPDDVLEWFELYLLEDLTRPDPTAEERLDPLKADKGDKLVGDLEVLRVLGSGATARVLKVQREGREFALKVSHNGGCGRKLAEEGSVLARLSHEHIVELHGNLDIGDRRCLLIDYAGDDSLADLLRAKGTLDLDRARRYGDDLLSAVRYLEEQGVTHRDIKPANIGFTARAKKAKHLVLYDFSLAAGSPEAITSGTAPWRDPWLHLRQRWDNAADRYAAACVLYRMVAGVRPEVAQDGPDEGRVRIEAERFDPSLRNRLHRFFERCFAEDVAERHASAEEMRTAWGELFSGLDAAREDDARRQAAEEALRSATPDTVVEALPLSARARNALDRARVVTVAHLLLLPRNHLSAIRGVGLDVLKEIVQVADRLRERLSVDGAPPLIPGYSGPRIAISSDELTLPSALVLRLEDTGVTSTHDLAALPRDWAQRLRGREGSKAAVEALSALAERWAPSGTLDEWVRDLLAPAKRRKTEAERRIRALVGLDPLPNVADTESSRSCRLASEVARAFGISPALVHSSLQAMRRRWASAASRPLLEAALAEVLLAEGPVCSLDEAARALASLHGAADEPSADDLRLAAGLVRLATELRPAPLHWRHLGEETWVASDPATLDALAALSAEAAALANEQPLASSDVALTRLAAKVAQTPLDALPPDRLVQLAARATEQAAASARLELYPRGMSAARATRLSLNVLLPPGLKPAVVRKRVQARYPEAEPLPPRPELDRLLAQHGLIYEPQTDVYLRPGGAHLTTGSTAHMPATYATALPTQRRLRTPAAMEAQAFEDALARGVESGRFRVVQVRADIAEGAAGRLAERLQVSPASLDRAMWHAIQRKAAELEVDPTVILATDRLGPKAPEWPQLRQLVELAAAEVVDELLAQREHTQLLVHPGVLARFELRDPLYALSTRAQNEEGAAVVLVVPSHADGLAPSINNLLPVPTVAGSQRLRMPESWLKNAHRAAAH